MKTFIQWLGGTADAGGNTFLLCMPTQRIMFGVGEGAQRVCAEHSIKIAGNTSTIDQQRMEKEGESSQLTAKLSSIWLTNLDWKCMGGLPGLLCTVADAGSKGVKLFGPKGLKGAICAMRPFLIRPDFDLQINEIDHQEWIMDGDIKVKAILKERIQGE